MRLKILAVLLLATVTAQAGTEYGMCIGAIPNVGKMINTSVSFETETDAALAAIRASFKMPHSDTQEYGGVIYQNKETKLYYYTTPVGGCGGSEVRYFIPKDSNEYSLEAIYHIHPKSIRDPGVNNHFSIQDAENVHNRVTGYLGVYDDENGQRPVWRLDPDFDPKVVYSRYHGYPVATGELVTYLEN